MAPSRAELIADTAIALIAERGLRGLTHRAVDEAAGLPQGSTSNYARTRAALLELAVNRLAVREMGMVAAAYSGVGTADELAEVAAHGVHQMIIHGRDQVRARWELALEATRRPQLRTAYDTASRAFREPAAAVLAAAGSTDPVRHSRAVLAWVEGILFDSIIGAGWNSPPTQDELRRGLHELIRGLLGPGGHPSPAGRPEKNTQATTTVSSGSRAD